MRKVLLAVATAAFILTGCGGHSVKRTLAPPYTVAVSGHPCSPSDFYMQCALHGRFGAQRGLRAPAGVLARGVDFAWGGPSCASFQANGWTIAATYLDSFDRSKGWNVPLVARYTACRVAHIAVWETTSNRATQGSAAGSSDARNALVEAAAIGMQPGRPIFFAIDCDCTGLQVDSYIRGVDAVLLPAHRPVGDYGGYYPTKYLFDHGLVTYGWQAYAWSAGQWDLRAKLEQWLNGSTVDYDRALAADYGQWPYTPPPPPPPAARPHCFGAHRQLNNPVCVQIRPQVSHWSQARDATLGALNARRCSSSPLPRNRGYAPVQAYLQTVARRSPCAGWRQRAGYFAFKVHENLY